MIGSLDLQTVALIVAIVIQVITAVIQAYSVVAISRAGREIAKRQLDVAHAKHQFELFDRRISVLTDASAVVFSAVYAPEKPEDLKNNLRRFTSGLMAANFLFDDDLVNHLHNIREHAECVAASPTTAAMSLNWLTTQSENRTLRNMVEQYFDKVRSY